MTIKQQALISAIVFAHRNEKFHYQRYYVKNTTEGMDKHTYVFEKKMDPDEIYLNDEKMNHLESEVIRFTENTIYFELLWTDTRSQERLYLSVNKHNFEFRGRNDAFFDVEGYFKSYDRVSIKDAGWGWRAFDYYVYT